MPGGTIYREQKIVLSPFEDDASDHFSAKTLFTGCFGINRFGLMEADPLIVQSHRRLMRRCEQLVVLADARKLRQRSSAVVSSLDQVSVLITDAGAAEKDWRFSVRLECGLCKQLSIRPIASLNPANRIFLALPSTGCCVDRPPIS